MKKAANVDEYIINSDKWQDSLILLRDIVLITELSETIKWGSPVYSFESKNILGIGAFKNYIALWFFQGALLKDKKKKLVNAQEGVTKALRQWRFGSIEEVQDNAEIIKEYIEEAIQNQKAGLEIKAQKNKPLVVPVELNEAIRNNPQLKKSFESFTQSKQREFAEYILGAKRPETKQKRLEKILPMILNGIGLNDKYRK